MEYQDYLGDGVYVDFDGYSVILTTRGAMNPQIIYMEPEVLQSFEHYLKKVEAKIQAEAEASEENDPA